MRPLIVIGVEHHGLDPKASEAIRDAMHMRWPEGVVHYAANRYEGFDMLEKLPGAVIAYAPGVFGDAVAGGTINPRIFTQDPQVVITTLGDPKDWQETTDPRQYVQAACVSLRVPHAVCVDTEPGMDFLAGLLAGEL